jgi:hypothetical protein
VAKFAGEQQERRAIELYQLLKLVRIQIPKVNLGPRRQDGGLGGLDSVEVLLLLILLDILPTGRTTRGHFFCCKEKFSGKL